MSFVKGSILSSILKPLEDIQKKSLNGNNWEQYLKNLNSLISMHEYLCEKHYEPFGVMWNEIVNDTIAVIFNALSGFYHTAIINLRSILEIACSSFYYYDHLIEYHLYEKEGQIADTYVSRLINDYQFYTTKYIRGFYKDIDAIQKEVNSVSLFLKSLYSNLCDVVHGRYSTFTKRDELKIEYSIDELKRFEKQFNKVLGVIAVMFVLRFSEYSDDANISTLANTIGVVNI